MQDTWTTEYLNKSELNLNLYKVAILSIKKSIIYIC